MVRILLYGYTIGVRSSRAIEVKCTDDVAFRWLAAGAAPDYRAIAQFRKRHLSALGHLFVQALALCQAAGMVRLGRVALDGTKVAELIVLATALRIPPITLLFGSHPREEVEVLPGQQVSMVEALAWFTGDDNLAAGAVAEPDSPAALLLRLTRRRAEKQQKLDMARGIASFYAEKQDEAKFAPAIDLALEAMDDVAEIDAAIDKQWSAIIAGRKEVNE